MERPARMTTLLILVTINGGGMIMKRIIYIGFAAIMAFAFSSCQKEAEIENVNENKLVKVVLRAEKAGETRTAAVESDSKVSYVWTDEDEANFRLYQVTTETTEQGTSEKYTAIENPTLTFSSDNRVLTVAAEVPASATLRAFVSGNWTNSATRPNPRLKVIQNPATDNFDPTADILVADDLVIPDGETEFNGTLKFNRPVTVNKMTLKGLASGETVSKVVLSSTNHLSGWYNPTNGSMTGDGKELTMQYSNVAVNGEFPVYFVAVPKEGHTLTVVVETSRGEKKYSYTKSFGSGNINFATGNFGKFSVNLAGLAEEVTDVDYSGEWIIAGTHSGHDLAATPWSSGYVYPASIVTLDPENEVVTVTGDPDSYRMTITLVKSGDYAGLYTIEDENGSYLSATGGTDNNNLTGKDDPDKTSYWSIEKNIDGTYDIIAAKLADDARKSMRVNYNSGNPRVTCYLISSGQPKVVLYPFENIEVDDTPTPVASFTTVAELNALATTTDTEVTGTLTDAIVSYVPDTKNAIIKDATGSVLFFKDGHGLKQGQTFSGEVTVKVKLYNGTAEIIACNATFTGAEATVAPVTYTLDQLVGNLSTYQNAYSKVENLEVTAVSGKNINVKNGTKTYVVYSNAGNATCAVGNVLTVTGTICHFGSNDQIKAWKATDIVVTGSTGGGNENEVSVTYDFTDINKYPNDFPTANGTAATNPTTFTIDGKSIIIKAPNAYYAITNGSKKALFFGKSTTSFATTAYIEIPAKAGYYVKSISVVNSSGCAANVAINVYKTDGTAVSTSVNTVKGGTMNFTISPTAVNTPYRICSLASGKNCQFDSITILYDK